MSKFITEEERRYLSAVITPFFDKVDYIEKSVDYFSDKVCIHISCRPYGDIWLMPFDDGEQYKGIKREKFYKPKDLGLERTIL